MRCARSPRTRSRALEDLPAFGADDLGLSQIGATPVHAPGRWVTTSSGSATWARCLPSPPGCLPGRRFAARRSARLGAGGLDKPSADGGIDELRGLRPRRCSRSAILASRAAICVACCLGHETEGSDLLAQLLIRGRVIERRVVVRWNSPRYARRFPRWWIAGSGDLNSYATFRHRGHGRISISLANVSERLPRDTEGSTSGRATPAEGRRYLADLPSNLDGLRNPAGGWLDEITSAVAPYISGEGVTPRFRSPPWRKGLQLLAAATAMAWARRAWRSSGGSSTSQGGFRPAK